MMNVFKREGLENNTASQSDGNSGADDNISNKNKANSSGTTGINKNTSSTTSSSQGLPMTITPMDNNNSDANANANANVDESFEVGRTKKNANGYNIDYASTIEDAYDELNKILGSDGIKRLTNDTQGLMKQQLQLAESMKNMQPLIAGMAPLMKQAEGLLGSMGDNGNLGNLADIAKQFSASLGKK
jgi:hypothetical protein